MTSIFRGLTVALIIAGALVLSATKAHGQATSADELFRRYAEASGGEAAIRAVRTRVSKGDVITPGGSAPLEIVQAAPNRFLRIIDSPVSGHSENAFDGSRAWSKNNSGIHEMGGPPVAMVERELHLHRPLAMASFYRSLGDIRADTLDGRPVDAVDCVAPDGTPETVYFDRTTGLLAGSVDSIGGTLLRTILSDYRAVDGVMIPFLVKRSRPDFAWQERFSSVAQNVVVDTTRLSKPDR